MKKTVEKAILRIAKRVKKETGGDITDFLYDAAENYTYNDEGKPSSCDWIIRGLENEADMYCDLIAEKRKLGIPD
ncbi:MAG: hypothetical protein IJI14_07535 [Anaerolineaceae bacterium]|nr:hypothetical protein [Anaerolineaceae bacterium]